MIQHNPALKSQILSIQLMATIVNHSLEEGEKVEQFVIINSG